MVFDCAAAFKGTSVNQQFLQDPNLNSTLLGVRFRFRQEPVTVTGNVQAIHQVKVPEADRDFLQFLWWPEGDLTKDMSEFHKAVHLFGVVSSLSFALREMSDNNQADIPAEVIQTVKENFYVDD